MTDATQKPEEASAEELAKRDAGCLAAGHESQKPFAEWQVSPHSEYQTYGSIH